jgi:hypothetical protein
LEARVAYSGDYTGDFPQRGHILAVFVAKFTMFCPNQAQNAMQDLPQDGAVAPGWLIRDVLTLYAEFRPAKLPNILLKYGNFWMAPCFKRSIKNLPVICHFDQKFALLRHVNSKNE